MEIYSIVNRIFIRPEEMENTLSFYENLTGVKCALRFNYSEKGLELAQVGPFLLIAGSKENLAHFRDTTVTFLVDSVDEFRNFLVQNGSTILEEPKTVPTGINMRVKHPDGLIVEYVEHKN